jgi:hypothetical protein
MSLLFDTCPLAADTPDTTKQDCPTNYGQLVKMAVWQKGGTPFTTTTIITSAGWAAAVADTGADKVSVTNYLTNLVVPQSAPVEQTSDTNINAIPELQYMGNVRATGMFRSIGGDKLVEIDAITPYSKIAPGVTQLLGVFINTNNEVIYNTGRADLGFELFNFVATDNDVKGNVGGLIEAQLGFYLLGGWSRGAAKLAVTAFDLLNSYPA